MRLVPLSEADRQNLDRANMPSRLLVALADNPEPWQFAEITECKELLDLIWLRQAPVEMVVPDDKTPLREVLKDVLGLGLEKLCVEADPDWWDSLRNILYEEDFDFAKMRPRQLRQPGPDSEH